MYYVHIDKKIIQKLQTEIDTKHEKKEKIELSVDEIKKMMQEIEYWKGLAEKEEEDQKEFEVQRYALQNSWKHFFGE